MRIPTIAVVGLLAAAVLMAAGCESKSSTSASAPATSSTASTAKTNAAGGKPSEQPNIIWIVWDTLRRDHMSLYGYDRKTTPNVDAWAAGARVYTNCVSPGSTTVPSHASMFTGLLPSEHGASNEHPQLDERFETIAELLRDKGGYQTYIFAANPHLTSSSKFTQGFQVEEHPWSPQYQDAAIRLIRAKLDPRDHSSEMGRKMAVGKRNDWTLKTAGALAQTGVERWLDKRDHGKPFFIFLNYMEAHRPLIPAARFREQMMSPAEIEESFKVDRGWGKTWAYTMGMENYTDEEIDLTRKTYDACLLELDDMFGKLIDAVRKRGELDNTIIILTADHGEQLGEHHMLDHQYSLYNPLLQVPLIIDYPPAFAPGQDDRPVMNFDLFPTLLRLAGVSLEGRKISALDLDQVPDQRLRLSEYVDATEKPVLDVKARYPKLRRKRWLRKLRALTDGDHKFICGSDGSHELYELTSDPGELHNLLTDQPQLLADYCGKLNSVLARLSAGGAREQIAARTPEEIKALEALGYAAGGDDDNGEGGERPAADGLTADFCQCGQAAGGGD